MCARLTATVLQVPFVRRSIPVGPTRIGLEGAQRKAWSDYSGTTERTRTIDLRGGDGRGPDDGRCGPEIAPAEDSSPPRSDLLHNRGVQPARHHLVARLHV